MPTIQSAIVLLADHLLVFCLLTALTIVVFSWLLSRAIRLVGERYVRAVSDRFSRFDSTRAYLILCGFLLILLSYTFFEIAELVFETDLANSLDLTIANTVHKAASPTEIGFFGAITKLGGSQAQITFGLLVGWKLLALRRRGLFAVWVLGLLGGSLLTSLLKWTYQRQRPVFENPLLTMTSDSFPSGHAMNSVIMYALMAYLIFVLAPTAYRYLAVTGALILGLMVGCRSATRSRSDSMRSALIKGSPNWKSISDTLNPD